MVIGARLHQNSRREESVPREKRARLQSLGKPFERYTACIRTMAVARCRGSSSRWKLYGNTK
jgi:hypothetical protein